MFNYIKELDTLAKYQPKNKEELINLINKKNINLGEIDTSLITDMSRLFRYNYNINFSGIELWDVSNVIDMSEMFSYTKFNENISSWDVYG